MNLNAGVLIVALALAAAATDGVTQHVLLIISACSAIAL